MNHSISEIELGKMPPNDPKLEQWVLGAIILEPDSYLEYGDVLNEGLWYNEANKIIYRAIKTISDAGKSIDYMTISAELKRVKEFKNVGEIHYLMALTKEVATSDHIADHIAILTQIAVKRKIIALHMKALAAAYDESEDVGRIIDTVENDLNEINNSIVGDEADGEIEEEIEATFTKMTTVREEDYTGLNTGNGRLTALIGGWTGGKLYALGGRPGSKKTTRAAQFARFVALELKKKVAFFSLEMSAEEIHKKMITSESGVDSRIIKANPSTWRPDVFAAIEVAKNRLKKSGMYIWDGSYLTPNKVKSICRKKKPAFVIIDYLQLMKANSASKNREQEVSDISRELKLISKQLNIPILALVQLSRELEKRQSKRPMLSDIRESGAIEQDCDVVMFMFTPSDYYDNPGGLDDEQYKKVSEIILAKNRDGDAPETMYELFHRYNQLFENKPGKEIKKEEDAQEDLPF